MRDGCVGAGSQLTNRLLDKRALGVAGAEERKIDNEQDPASLGESQGGENQTEKQGDLEGGDDTHASIVVLLNEAANRLGERVALGGGLRVGGAGRRRTSTLGCRIDSRNQVHAAVSSDMEDGVHAEGQESEDELAGVKPDESHAYRRSQISRWVIFSPRGRQPQSDKLTQILHVLIRNELGNDLWHVALHTSSKVALVHDDSICHGGGDKGEAVGKDGPRGVVVEGDERKRIAEDGKEQSQVSTSVVSDLDLKILARSAIMDELFGQTYPTNQANLQ